MNTELEYKNPPPQAPLGTPQEENCAQRNEIFHSRGVAVVADGVQTHELNMQIIQPMTTKHKIPERWEENTLEELVNFFNGKGHEKNIIEYGSYIVVNSKFISTNGNIKKFSNQQLSPLYENDIVMVMSDVPNGKAIAKCFYIKANNKYTLNQRICRINSIHINSKFLFLVLNRHNYLLKFDDGVKQTNLRKDDILQCPILYPKSKFEQEAIVGVLEVWDQYVCKLKEKIEIKKQIKKGLMQQLLTARTRLPGFTGDWEEKKLGEVGAIFKGKGLSKDDLDITGKYNCIHYGELFTKYNEKINNIISKTNKYENPVLSNKNDVLMPTSDVTPRGLSTASWLGQKNVILGGDILIIRPNEKKLNGLFLSYSINYKKGEIIKLVSGSTVFHLYGSDMKKYTISFPSLPEQKAIAEVLTACDTEIEKLEEKLKMIEAQKKYLLNNLITGAIRLPEFKA